MAYLSYSSGVFDARSFRMARSALRAGYHVTMYARWEAGQPPVEERDGYRLIRVSRDWRLAVPGLRNGARTRAVAAMAEAARLAAATPAGEAPTAPDDQVPREAAEAVDGDQVTEASVATAATGASVPGLAREVGVARRVARRMLRPLRRWRRMLMQFPFGPLGWAAALESVAEPADIWHGMWAGSLPALARMRALHGGRTIYDSRDVYMLSREFYQLEPPLRAILTWLERRWAGAADQVLTVNEPYADLLARQLRVPRPPVVMNCPEPWTATGPRPDLIRNSLGLRREVAVVLYQGQLIQHRGIEQSMDAILDVPGAVLVLLGFGSREAAYRASAAAAPYAGRVFLLPAVPPSELLAWTASADVTVVPIQPTTMNHRFTTPQKLFESIAAGVPVVASDLPGMRGVVTSTGVGVLCDPTSPASIAAAIRSIIAASTEERDARRARTLAAAADRYNWESQASALLALYAELLRRPDGGPARRSSDVEATGVATTRGGRVLPRIGRVRRRVVRLVRKAGGWQARDERRRVAIRQLTRRARDADTRGEATAARDAWAEVVAMRVEAARVPLRLAEGRLIETDPSWLPTVPGSRERLGPASRRRVLHLAKSSVPDRWSGYTIRTHSNVRAQAAAGLEPVVVTEIGWPRVVGITDFAPVVEVDGIPHHRLDRGPSYDPRLLPNDVRLDDLAAALVPVVEAVRPAILNAHSGHRGGELALVALALRERFGIPVVYEVRGLFESVWSADSRVAYGSERYARYLAQETRILGAVDGVLAISQALIEELASRGIPRAKMSQLPNAVDPAAFGAVERDPALRERLGLDGRFVVGYVGNLDHVREGIEVLAAALAELHGRGRREVAVLVVGDGRRRPEMEAEAGRLGVAADCRFTGRIPHDQVPRYYAQIDLFVNPRIDERAARYITPLKPFEAMALGLPVLVSDLPALNEIVDPPNRGLSAPPGDPVGLADAIERLLDDPGLRARVAAAGREWVLAERTWATNGPRYRAAYEAIMGPLD